MCLGRITDILVRFCGWSVTLKLEENYDVHKCQMLNEQNILITIQNTSI